MSFSLPVIRLCEVPYRSDGKVAPRDFEELNEANKLGFEVDAFEEQC